MLLRAPERGFPIFGAGMFPIVSADMGSSGFRQHAFHAHRVSRLRQNQLLSTNRPASTAL
jgi:hypothetical protein